MKSSRFLLVAIASMGLTAWCYATMLPKPKPVAPLRPSAHITTLADGTQVINTTTLGADVIGYQGQTPVAIHLKAGRIVKIEFLPHGETPRFYQRAIKGMQWATYEGKTLQEAQKVSVDAVSGATLSSHALVENIRRGIAHGIKQQKPTKKK